MRGIVRAAAGAVGIGVAAFAGTGAFDDNTTRDESGAIVESGGLGAFQMQVGDCFNDPEDLTAELIASVEGVPCHQPHDNEVFAEFDVTYSTFPGQDEVYTDAWWRCYDHFERWVGNDWESSSLEISALTPSDASWAEGDREITCFVYDATLQKLTGTTRGSGL